MSPSEPPEGEEVDAVILRTPAVPEAVEVTPENCPLSFISKLFNPGTLNLVIDVLPKVISLETLPLLAFASFPITILLLPVVGLVAPA